MRPADLLRDTRARITRSERVEVWLVVALLGRTLARLTRSPRWQGRATRAYDRLGRLREGASDRAGAIRAYETAVGLDEESAAPGRRLELAGMLEEAGRWDTATRHLEHHLAQDPRDALVHRRLASVAGQVWRWGGAFHGSAVQRPDLRFRPARRGDAGTDDQATAHLARAVEALERAVLLEPERTAWRGALGALQRASGDLEAARRSFEAAVGAIESSDRQTAFRSLHRWQFELERVHHDLDAARVADPLFACEMEPATEQEHDLTRPAGLFETRLSFAGLMIDGLLTDDSRTVEVLLDDVCLRRVEVSGESFLPTFALGIGRPALDRFPPRSTLRVRREDGRLLRATGGGHGVRLSVPHGDGGILADAEQRTPLDKKGMPTASAQQLEDSRRAHAALYQDAKQFFDDAFDRPLFVFYGTLLGLYRDGDLIPGDDDVDVSYVSQASEPVAVKDEAKRLIATLVRAGFTVSFNRSGRLFRIHGRDMQRSDVYLDVHPVWFRDGRLWVHNHTSFPCERDAFLPVAGATLRGEAVHVPRRPEVFLEGHYGPGWKVPDPGFTYHPEDVPRKVRSQLRKALMTPQEYRRLAGQLDDERSRDPQVGRFVSIGSQPLYPIDEFLA